MSRSAEGAVGSIRRLGRPRPSQPTRSPRRAPPYRPPPARPAGRPGRATAPSSRRPCRRALVGLSRAPAQSASGRKRPPSLRPHPHRRGRRETCPPPFPAPAAPSANSRRPNPALASLTLAMTFLRPAARKVLPALPTRPPQEFRPPSLPGRDFPSGPLRPERPRSCFACARNDIPAARPLIGAAGSHVLAEATSGRRETLPTAVLPDRPFCPRPAARPRALRASGRPFRRQRDAFILWRPNGWFQRQRRGRQDTFA
jgi:hypothetical protein